jgi:hypothetical protein
MQSNISSSINQSQVSDYNPGLMEQRIFHGKFTSEELANCLLVHFNRGNLVAQELINGENYSVQIKTKERRTSGGETALGISFRAVEDGILVEIGQQTWAGIAANLGATAVEAIINPINLLHHFGDITQDFEYFQLTDEVLNVLEANAKALGGGYGLSQHLKRTVCDYCQTANPTSEPSCIACGAPLGVNLPHLCSHCGFVLNDRASYCPNCKNPV